MHVFTRVSLRFSCSSLRVKQLKIVVCLILGEDDRAQGETSASFVHRRSWYHLCAGGRRVTASKPRIDLSACPQLRPAPGESPFHPVQDRLRPGPRCVRQQRKQYCPPVRPIPLRRPRCAWWSSVGLSGESWPSAGISNAVRHSSAQRCLARKPGETGTCKTGRG